MIKEKTNTKLKISIDIFSGISLIFLFVVCPIWGHYNPNINDDSGKMLIMTKLLLADSIPSIFGIIWLAFRYGEIIAKKYPFILTQKFKLLSMFGIPLLYLIGYLIIKNIFWR